MANAPTGMGRGSPVRQMTLRFVPPATAALLATDVTVALGLAPALTQAEDGAELLTLSVPADLVNLLRQAAEIHGGREAPEPPGTTHGGEA